jgi:hypothetical protein
VSSIEEEIAAVKEAAQKKLRRLRERERKEQQVLDLRVVALMRERHWSAYEKIRMDAQAQLDAEAVTRAERARRGPRLPADAQRGESISSGDASARLSEHVVAGER